MTTITILLQLPGQTIPRPFNRASSVGELQDMIAEYGQRLYGDDLEAVESNIDSEEPILVYPHKGQGFARFYAFTEA